MEMIRKQLEARHPRAMLSRAAQRLRNAIITLLLLTAGALSASAQTTPDFTVNGVGYSSYWSSTGNKYASIMSYAGTAETLVIPDTVQNGITKYSVTNIGCSFTSSSGNDYPLISRKTVTFTGVKTLTIQGSPTLCGTIELPDAETLVFEKTFSRESGASPITCPKLAEIYFKGSTPSLGGDGSKYFADNRIGSITAYVAGKTQEECDQMKATQAVWCEFKDVRPYNALEEKVNIVVTNTTTPLGNPCIFSDGLDNFMTTAGTQTYQVDKYGDYTFRVDLAKGAISEPTAVYVNGKDILSQMTPLWGSTGINAYINAYRYTLENVAADTYIQIMADDTRYRFFLKAEEGGKVKVGSGTARAGQQIFYVSKGISETLTIIPDVGYELGEYWRNGVKETMVAGADGSCTKTLTGTSGGNIVVTFKQKALPTWTVVQTGNTIESEMVLTRGFIDEVVACDNPITTQAFGSDVEKVKLRIPMAGEAGSTLRVLFFRDGEGLMLTPFDTVNEMGNPTTIFVSNGSDVTSLGTVADGYLNFEFSAAKLANATWVITTEPEMSNPTWTVVKTDNATVAEVVVTDSVDTVLPCTDPFTTQTINPENLTKATLRVATTGESSEYSVYLVNSGSNKVTVIGVVRELTGMGLKDAKALVDSADGTTPILVATFPTAAEAQAAKEALEAAGATVQVEGDGTPTRVFRDGVDVTAQGTADGNYLCFEVSPDNLANTTWVITTEPVMPDPFDVNGDGVIDTKDATIVIDKYLNQ